MYVPVSLNVAGPGVMVRRPLLAAPAIAIGIWQEGDHGTPPGQAMTEILVLSIPICCRSVAGRYFNVKVQLPRDGTPVPLQVSLMTLKSSPPSEMMPSPEGPRFATVL